MSNFWEELLNKDRAKLVARYDELWEMAGAGEITKDQAVETLELLWLRTHLDLNDLGLRKHYPTKQGGHSGRLAKEQALWWVDHATAGVNHRGTLSWFSSKERTHTRKFSTKAAAEAHYGSRRKNAKIVEKDGKWVLTWRGSAGAVTHFVVSTTGTPYYIVDIANRCWGEPKRNRDGIHIEMINPLICKRRNGRWHFWAGPIPQSMLDHGQLPTRLDKPFRGVTTMMPYTWTQVITNIKLKRLCIAATDGRMSRERMSHHTDWRETKFDMGPLWPRELIDDAAFEQIPIEEYAFMKHFVNVQGADDIVSAEELDAIEAGTYDEYDMPDAPGQDPEVLIDTTVELQETLIKLYGDAILPVYGADGDLGGETTNAVKVFQRDWNRAQPSDKITIDGIPGPQTYSRLQRVHDGSVSSFKPTAV